MYAYMNGASLIRKAKALAEGYYGVDGSRFGGDLRRLIGKVAEGCRTDGPDASVKRLMRRIQWNCQCNKHQIEEKVRQLAREILNDWDVVIARRISFGTRTDEGGRFYAAGGCDQLRPG
jgi:hypothetical protein